MKLEQFTFGKTPAAVYLYDYLKNLNKPLVSKKTGKILTSFRNTLSQLEEANLAGILNAHNLAKIINLMRAEFKVEVGDNLASNLATNILVGEMKTLIRKSEEIRKIEIQQNKIKINQLINNQIINKKGYKIAELIEDKLVTTKYNVSNVQDDINAQTLTDKSLLKNKNKKFES